MTQAGWRLLPESTLTFNIVDNAEFTVVTGDGEIYTLFRIVRITHECTSAELAWTHLANVARIVDHVIGVARLQIVEKVIIDAAVTLSDVEP